MMYNGCSSQEWALLQVTRMPLKCTRPTDPTQYTLRPVLRKNCGSLS